jgi:DNA-binding Xre family transcriptional regulator
MSKRRLAILLTICTFLGCQLSNGSQIVLPVLPASTISPLGLAEDFEQPKPYLTSLEKQYVGLKLAQAHELARQQGHIIRVGSLDGKCGPLTADMCFGRITVALQNDIVTGFVMVEGAKQGFSDVWPTEPKPEDTDSSQR